MHPPPPPAPPASPSPPALGRLCAEAGQELSRGHYPEAIQILERAQHLDPANRQLALDLGYAHAMNYDFAAAARWFERAVELAPDPTALLLAVADRWSDVRHFDAAARAYERALELGHAPVGAFYGLAKICLRQRRLDRARDLAARAGQQHGTHEAVLLTQARVCRETGDLAGAEPVLRTLLARPGGDPEARATGLYELGTLLDRQGRYDDAMTAFIDAKAILGRHAEPARKILRAKQAGIREVQRGLTPALVGQWRLAGTAELQPPRRLALLCGHARSGTTLLEYILDAHPQIISADETSVFQGKAYPLISRSRSAKDTAVTALSWITPRNLRQVRAEYWRGMESFLGQPIGERLLLDKNPALTADLAAFARFFPETRFLVMLRDPRDVCLSCFMQPAPLLPDTVPWLSLEDTIRHYALQAELWLALRPCLGPAALEVRYEDLVQNLESGARRALAFLGVDWDERVLRFNEHAQTRTICSPTYAEVTRPLFKTAVGRWQHYRRYFEPHRDLLAPVLQALGYDDAS
jgi:Flp pilus assembly protein TadD